MNYYNKGIARFKHPPQVIVVGASLSGIRAAYDLQRAGISCIVLEARNSIGGGFHDGVRAAQCPEAWVNPDQHPRTWNLVHDLGLEVARERRSKSIMHGFGAYDHDEIPFIDQDDRRSYTHILESMEILSRRIDRTKSTQMMLELSGDTSMTFKELIISQGATPAIQKLADTWTTTVFGLAARDVPALAFLLSCRNVGGFLSAIGQSAKGTTDMRIQKPQTLCEAHAQRLDRGSVFLSQRVIHIDQRPDSKCVLSTTAGETFVCLRVIMALQMPAEHLDFTPLPGSFNQGLQDYEPLSFCYQTTLVYDQPWWRTKGLSGYSQSTEGPIWETYDTSSYDDGVYTLTCIVAGESGHELWNKNLIERRDTILTHLKDVFSMYTAIPDPVLRIEPKGTVLTRSISNITGPEGLVIADGWKVKGRVHFAAPGLKFMRKSHLEAALCLGSRVAEEIRTSVMPMEETILSKL